MTFIRGKQVELRVLEDGDAETYTQAVNAGLTTQHLFTGSIPMRTADYKERWATERKAGDILFGVWIRGGFAGEGAVTQDRLIGTCGLHSHRDVYGTWESRFLIFCADSVGKGYGKEVVALLTVYAFRRLNAHLVWLGVSEDNKRAVKCYLDCGYVIEGRHRDRIYYDGKRHATITMSIVREECLSIAQ